MKNTFLHIIILALIGTAIGYAFLTVEAQEGLVQNVSSNTDIVAQKFINQIDILKSVKLDTSILTEQAFQSFVDWTRPIPEEEKGRPNPFAPIN